MCRSLIAAAERIAERGLIFEGFLNLAGPCLHLIEQAYILDGDHGLIRERGHQLDLFGRKWLGYFSGDEDHSYDVSLAHERRAKSGSVVADLQRGGTVIFGIGQNVRNVYYPTVQRRSAYDTGAVYRDRILLEVFLKFRREAIGRRRSRQARSASA
jgi:hypothetical protein